MFRDVILGLLCGGPPRHGYELMTEYRARSGNQVSAGNFYRELARLAADDLVETGVNPPEADARRIPYQITERGRRAFEEWLVAPAVQDEDYSTRLLFLDQLTPAVQAQLLDQWQEDLWLRSKALSRARDDALRNHGNDASGNYDARPALIARRLKQVSAELEFVKEFRAEFDAWQRAHAGKKPAASGARSGDAKREKGPSRS